MEDNKQSILYRPSLEVPRSYYADGIIEPKEEQELIKQAPLESSNDLIKEIESIKKTLLFLPSAIRLCTESILNLVHFLLILIEDNYEESDAEDENYEITTPSDKPSIVPGDNSVIPPHIDLDDIFSTEHKSPIIIREQITEKIKINRSYSRSTYDISVYYIEKLKNILTDYHNQLLIQKELKQVLNTKYNEPLLDQENNLAHSILQTLLKSQHEKESKMRLYQKLYNEKEGLTLLKSLEYSKLTLLKNVDAAPTHMKLYYKHMQMLESEKNKLDKKLFEYYRYLDSSLILLQDCLNLNITEAIAKVELNKINDKYKKEHNLL